jgi:hypothetical protein
MIDAYIKRLRLLALSALDAPEPDQDDVARLLDESDESVTGRAKPQNNIVYRYLVKCRGRSLDVAAGFCAVLSDFVANSSEGFTLKATDYQKVLKIRAHAARISAADENLRTWKSIQRITGEDYGPMPPDFGTPGRAKKQRDARKKQPDAR